MSSYIIYRLSNYLLATLRYTAVAHCDLRLRRLLGSDSMRVAAVSERLTSSHFGVDSTSSGASKIANRITHMNSLQAIRSLFHYSVNCEHPNSVRSGAYTI